METALQQQAKKNKWLSLVAYTLTTAASLTAAGTLMQTFLATLGMPPEQVYIHATITQGVNVATLLISSRWITSNNALKGYALTTIPYALLFLAILPFCLGQEDVGNALFWLILIGALQAAAVGLRTVSSYIMPYLLYPAEDYGPLQSLSGIVSSVFSLALGALISLLTTRMDFSVLMTGACIVSAVFMLVEAVLTFRMRSIIPQQTQTVPKKKQSASLKESFSHPAFYTLFLPFLLRGFANGTTTIFAAMAFGLGYDEILTSKLLYLQSVAGLLGCGVIGILSRHISIRYPVLLGSLSFLLLPLFFMGNGFVFLAAATAVVFGRTLVDYGVPILLRKAVPIEIAGTYNAWRMILHTGGSLIATTMATMIPVKALAVVTMVCAVLSGCSFFLSKCIRKAE